MIALWMLSAIVFTLFLAVAAWWGERALRIAGRPTRGVWMLVLAAGTLWPVVVPLLRRLHPAKEPVAAGVVLLDAVRIDADHLTSGVTWLPLLDRLLLGAWLLISLMLLFRYVIAWRATRVL